ncbi:MAG: ABC transporter permease [Clostridia bacterium]|nr:ABC transporter permease [Clostridia bacterium]
MRNDKKITVSERTSAPMLNEQPKNGGINGFFAKEGTQSVLASLVCISAGLIIGFIVMLLISAFAERMSIADAFSGLAILVCGPFSSGSLNYITTNFGDMIFYAAPLILTGLSVAIAFKTGLFNIGAPGQFLMGTAGSLYVALSIDSRESGTGVAVWLLALLVGMICGMVWGAIPGLFKAFFGVNEVIVCIMTNWIAANLVSWFFSEKTNLINTGYGKSGYLITTEMTGNSTPKIGLDKVFSGSYIDSGIFIAAAVAVIIYIVLNKTIFGYELKACGNNRNAARYAGMNEKRNIILSMAIAGCLAALGGAVYYLNPGIEFAFSSAYSKLPDYGFNGIPVALLASNNPVGVIFSGIFLRYLGQGGDNLTSAGFNRYIADIIIALIIYFAGFSKLIRDLINKKRQMSMKKTKAAEDNSGAKKDREA